MLEGEGCWRCLVLWVEDVGRMVMMMVYVGSHALVMAGTRLHVKVCMRFDAWVLAVMLACPLPLVDCGTMAFRVMMAPATLAAGR